MENGKESEQPKLLQLESQQRTRFPISHPAKTPSSSSKPTSSNRPPQHHSHAQTQHLNLLNQPLLLIPSLDTVKFLVLG